jgi:hypothetical protein
MNAQAWSDWQAIDASLGKELMGMEAELARADTQKLRRNYCREVFAYAEAITACIKRYVIGTYYPGMLGNSEEADLERRDGALMSIFRALDLFTNTAGATTPMDRGSPEWHTLHAAIRIRNRITHPTCADDVVISDGDLANVCGARKLLIELIVHSLERSAAAHLNAAAVYQHAFDEQKRTRAQTDARTDGT